MTGTSAAAAAGAAVRPPDTGADDEVYLLPASFAQQRLWLLDQREQGTARYNLPVALQLSGPLDAGALRRAFAEIVRRHEALRTTFTWSQGEALQVIAPQSACRLPLVDLAALPAAARGGELAAQARRAAARGFDLQRGPLLRLLLLRDAPERHVLVATLHHIVSDGWSTGVLVRELGALYDAFRAGRPSPLADLEVQYADYALWERELLAGAELERLLEFWRPQVADLPVLRLPTDRPRPPLPGARGGHLALRIAPPLAAAAAALGQAHGCTPFMVLLAVFQALLGRYSGQTDFAVGAPVANRGAAETEPLIGFFVNALALRADLAGGPDCATLLARTRQRVLAAFAHQQLPFERLAEEVRQERPPGHAPFFDVMLGLQTAPIGDLALAGLRLAPLPLPGDTAKFDLTAALEPAAGGGFTGDLEFRVELYDRATVARLAEHLSALLAAAARQPRRPLAELPLLGAAELHQHLREWNDATGGASLGARVHQLFAWWAARQPAAPAVRYPGGTLSYGELDAAANRLARHLRALGVAAETPVAFLLERSPAAIVAMLAILKAGGTYVPLQPRQPPDRLQLVAADTGAPVLITSASLAAAAPPRPWRVVVVDQGEDAAAISRQDPGELADITCPGSRAYILYTSGSSGRPKGIAVPHRAIVRLVREPNYVRLSPADRVAQVGSLGFDGATFEVWGALLNGAELVGIDRDMALAPAALAHGLRQGMVSVIFLTTALLNRLIAAEPDLLAGVGSVLFGGEAADAAVLRRLLAAGPPGRLVHVYGPTETTTFAASLGLAAIAPDAASVPIGRPLGGTRLQVLDGALLPVPAGVEGELYIGGAGLARGYHGSPDLTAAAFVPDPLAPRPGERLYRTGDRVRRRAGGEVEFLGRSDGQVKVRGLRVEPAEIEAVLRQHPAVAAALVVPHRHAGEVRLAAYLVVHPGAAAGEDSLRALARRKLPEAMMPGAFVPLAALPLTVNGKIDRQALPLPDWQGGAGTGGRPRLAPRTPVETTLAAIWCEVLGRQQVGVEDNFFDLGGDSILATQIVARANAAGLKLAPSDLFQQPTIAELAALAGRDRGERAAAAAGGRLPLAPIQLWFLEQPLRDPQHYNQSLLLAVRDRRLRPPLLAAAVRHLAEHHAALRLRFTAEPGGGWVQEQGPPPPRGLCQMDLAALPEVRRDAQLAAACDAVQASLHLGGPLLRAVWFDRGAGAPPLLLLVFHHLIMDGVSLRIVVADLAALAAQLAAGAPPRLPAASSSYAQWVQGLAKLAADGAVEDELDYWLAAERTIVRRLPRQGAGAGGAAAAEEEGTSVGQLATLEAALDAATTTILVQEAPQIFGTRLHEVLLAALVRAVAAWCGGQGAVLIDLEGHGRETELLPDLDLSRTVGWFTTIVPVPVPIAGGEAPEVTLLRVRQRLREMPHRGLGYGLLRHLSQAPQAAVLRRLPAAEVSLNYLGQLDGLLPEGAPFAWSTAGAGREHSRRNRWHHPLHVNASVSGGRLQLAWIYGANLFGSEAIAALAARCAEELHTLAARARRIRAAAGGGIQDLYPLAPSQLGMLFESLGAPGRGLHLEQLLLELRGPLDLEALERAWQTVVERHPILRTSFLWDGPSEPLQVVHRQVQVPLGRDSWREPPAAELAGRLAAWLDADRRRGLDLGRAPLLRLAVLSGDRGVHRLLWTYHHILLDGWSVARVLEDLFAAYGAWSAGRTPRLAPAAAYGDYVRWLRDQDPARAEAFWRRQLAGFAAATPLRPPRRGAAAAAEGPHHAEAGAELGAALSERLGEVARRRQLTPNTLFLGAWSLLLARRAGRPEVVFGTTVSGRPTDLPGVETMAGLLANSIPLRVAVAPERELQDWLAGLQQLHLAAAAHGLCAAGQIQRWSAVGDGAPLYDSLVVFENYPTGAALERAGELTVQIAAVDTRGGRTHHALTLLAAPGAPYRCRLIYDRDSFTPDEAGGILDQVELLLGEMTAAGPAAVLGDLLDRLPAGNAAAAAAAAGDAPGDRLPAAGPAPAGLPRDAVELRLTRIWEELLGAAGAGPRQSFFELGGHSLAVMALLARVRDTFGQEVSLASFLEQPTIERLAHDLRQQSAAPWSPLLLLRAQGAGAPLFCVHSGSGSSLCYVELARHLGGERPFYGLEAPGLDGVRQPHTTMDAMAAHYVAAVRGRQPHGPYLLAGHSFGGLVALAMAGMLERQGERVASLLILDTPAPGSDGLDGLGDPALAADDARCMTLLANVIGHFFGRPLDLQYEALAALQPGERLRRFAGELRRVDFLPPDQGLAVVRGLLDVYKANNRCLGGFAPLPIAAPITVLRAVDLVAAGYERLFPTAAGHEDLGWRRWTSGPVATRAVPGDHITMLVAPHAAALAACIEDCLRELDAGTAR